ncbi:MAG: C69 family dipeptidase [Paracoccaceae bacterium]
MSYGIYIGKNHAAEGHGWLAGYGDEPSSHWLEVVPRASHPAGSTVTVGVDATAEMPGHRTDIPQVPETARHLRVSYSYFLGVPAPITNGGLNEHGVAVRDIWSPSRAELITMTPTDQTGPTYSDLAHLVLERARTAREGVDLIGALIAEHGYSCYGGNSHIIADPDEAWVVLQYPGGLRLWVAERLGPDAIRASRPGYITAISAQPNADFQFPDHFISTAIKLGWYDPAQGQFNPNSVYGDGKGRWDGVAWIEDELRARAARPEKIRFDDVVWAIATERLTGDTAGYGQVVPLVHPRHDALRVMWHAPVGPVTAPHVPVFMGMTDVPAEYGPHRYLTTGEAARFHDRRKVIARPNSVSTVPQGAEITRSAMQIFKHLMQAVFQDHETMLPMVQKHWRGHEARFAVELADVLRSAEVLIDAGEVRLATRLLDQHARACLLLTLDEADHLLRGLEAMLRVGGKLNLDHKSYSGPAQIW